MMAYLPPCLRRSGQHVLFLWLLLSAFTDASAQNSVRFGPDTMTLFDQSRHRSIPIAIYRPAGPPSTKHPVVIISHGWNDRLPGTYLRFSSMAGHLAEHGSLVVSVQHELPGDAPLAMEGDLRTLRLPDWQRGVENLIFVINTLSAKDAMFDPSDITLIGHSHGGDISMLFAQEHPDGIRMAISLDNRRMPLPRTGTPRIASLRAVDVEADEGVLPTREEALLYGIQVIEMPGFRHVDFNDRGTADQRAQLNRTLLELIAGE